MTNGGGAFQRTDPAFSFSIIALVAAFMSKTPLCSSTTTLLPL
ncbi:hypothetical protein ALO_05750 [Acetonema longum DSM 6540]|uniref:Uncharacterized protein n=1 Tax=Acetonema longum DSM 6540 TaxID=1009370 RepID=F7NGG2_9FIRM|nr:hypothetical protein ALO_05750 [Acetonema longum DSM 6540]